MGAASKAKGSGFERLLCRKFSLWVSHGQDEDLFWRSSMSGGRATIAQRKGRNVRQSGDLCAVSPKGHALTDVFFIEAKAYRNLQMAKFLLLGTGPIAKFWEVAFEQALSHGKYPMLVCRQNGLPIIVLVRRLNLNRVLRLYVKGTGEVEIDLAAVIHRKGYDVYLLEDLLKCQFS
jgi:hypothetical protein